MYQYLGGWQGTFSIDPDVLTTDTGANGYARADTDRKWGINIDADGNATHTVAD